MVDAAIPLLRAKAALELLAVAGSGLCLDADPHGVDSNDGVPGAAVSWQWKGDLRRPRGAIAQSGAQPLEEAEMRLVAEGGAGRVGAHVEIEADDSECAGQVDDAQAVSLPTFQPTPAGTGEAGSACRCRLTEIMVQPSHSYVTPEFSHDLERVLARALRSAFLAGHEAMVVGRSSPALIGTMVRCSP
jgi:hypothetical protein